MLARSLLITAYAYAYREQEIAVWLTSCSKPIWHFQQLGPEPESMADQSVTYSLRHQARALAAQAADKFNSRWLVGTNSLKEENEVSWGFHTSNSVVVICVVFDTHGLSGSRLQRSMGVQAS